MRSRMSRRAVGAAADPFLVALEACGQAYADWMAAVDAHGLGALPEAKREQELLRAACYVVPTTPAGVLAFVRFLNDEILFDEKGQPGGTDGERAVRQSLATLRDGLATLFGIPPESAAHVDAQLTELWRLRGEAYQVLRAAGAPRVDDVDDKLCDRPIEIEAEIQKLQPATSNLLAALTLIEIGHVCDPREMVNCPNHALILAVRLLAALRPLLSGAVAEEVGELLDSPGLPLGVMALWPHSVNLSPAELAELNERTTAEFRRAWRRHDAHYGRPA